MKRLALTLLAFAALLSQPAGAARIATVAVTETIAGTNPYGDSVALMNSVWCQTYGCWMRWGWESGEPVSDFFDSWKTEDPLTWVFHLKPGLKRHNGEPVVPADFVHTVERIKTDPQSHHQYRVAAIAKVEVRDPETVVVKTKEPTATLLDALSEVIVTSKAQWDAHGKAADRDYAFGIGPYRLKELAVDDHVVIEKVPGNKLLSPDNPDLIVFKIMKEPEQRVTALLNGEVQIAQFIPPQLVPTVEGNSGAKLGWADTYEAMFVAMSPKTPPFDKKEVRQAVAYAIDRDAIIASLLHGQATKLDGPVGPGQIGYTPDLEPKYRYDPDKARALLKQAGYPDGVAVDFYATVGRYTADRQICEAIAAMLDKVGFKVDLKEPEWATMWSDAQKGKLAFYYMGRGSMLEPTIALTQYFGTGVTPRIGYSNQEVDRLLAQVNDTFDDHERMQVLQKAMSKITEDAPAAFLWRHKLAWGIAKNVDFQPVAIGDVRGWTIHMH